jgi:hypothetical protein
MNEELYITFENYFNNELSQEEKLEFELQLQNDADIKEKFEIYKEINGYLETKFSSETIDFKKNLESISNQNFSENKKEVKVISFKPWYYAVAASVAILFGTWFFMQNAVPNYSDYATHETAIFTERGEVIKNLKIAEKAFNNKNYKEAIVNFEIVLKDYKRPEIEYYYGISLLEENRYTDAEKVFTQIKSGKSVYKDKATWQLALSSLKQKKYEDCKKYINQIPADAEDYKTAQKLLKKLD